MMNKKEYIGALDSVKVSDELRLRIISAAENNDKVVHRKSRRTGVIISAAACVAVVAVGAAALPGITRMGSKSADMAVNEYVDESGAGIAAEEPEAACVIDDFSAAFDFCAADSLLESGGKEGEYKAELLTSAEDFENYKSKNPGFFKEAEFNAEKIFAGNCLLALRITADEASRFTVQGITEEQGVITVAVREVKGTVTGTLADHPAAVLLQKTAGEAAEVIVIIE